MRVRKRGGEYSSVTTSVFTGPSPGALTNHYGDYPWKWVSSYESICDLNGKRQVATSPFDRVDRAMRPVEHVRYRTCPNTANMIRQMTSLSYASTNPCAIMAYENNLLNRDLSPWFLSFAYAAQSSSRIPGGYYQRWEKCKPTLATRANMFVFLYELRDIKRMFEVLPGKHFKLTDWKSVLKYANGQHLNYNFGWKPFISDIKAVKKAYDSFDARLTKFMREQNLQIKRRWRDTVDGVYKIYPFGGGAWAYDGQAIVTGTVTEASSFHFRYAVPQYAPDELRRRAWLDSFGLNLTAANVWRVIPWSFVVDWFYNVSRILDEHTEDWIVPYIDFIQGCDSLKSELTVSATLTNRNYPNPMDMGKLYYSHYGRTVPGVPYASGATPSLDADKIRLLASLGASRLL